jgi:7-alpha-hydroxysteroid dehydrogenase
MTDQDGTRLNGKVAIVTGASSGLGRATAMALAQHGADVALIARSRAELQEVAGNIASGSGRRALPLPLDLADETALIGAVARTMADLGRVDVLINAAERSSRTCGRRVEGRSSMSPRWPASADGRVRVPTAPQSSA